MVHEHPHIDGNEWGKAGGAITMGDYRHRTQIIEIPVWVEENRVRVISDSSTAMKSLRNSKGTGEKQWAQ